MNKTFLTSKLTPIITIILCAILYMSGYFQMIVAALLMIIASVIEYKKDAFKSLGFERKKLNVKNILLIAPLLAIAFFLFNGYVLLPVVTTKFFGSSKISIIINILLLGVLFGLSHAYQGITGMVLTAIIGMLFAVIFHIRKNDLWFNIALHFFIDVIGLIYMYYGWLQ